MIAQLAGIREVRHRPAVNVVFADALFGEALEMIDGACGLCAEQRVTPDLLGRAAIVDFVKLMPAAELAGDLYGSTGLWTAVAKAR